jgi:hypothetical protein
MSTATEEQMEMGTKPLPEHAWLNKMVGEWKTETEMMMPDGSTARASGTESIKNLGGLWAYAEGHGEMPGGGPFTYYAGLGYDVSFKEYRGFRIMSASSHLWKYKGTLSSDGKVMTLDCEGPNMFKDGETALYKDVFELVDGNHMTLTSSGQDENGNWMQFMKASYTRA